MMQTKDAMQRGGHAVLKKMIAVSDIEACIEALPDDETALNALIEAVGQLPTLDTVPCGECPSYVRMEGGTFPGRCKRLGFWFPEAFSCGYCETNERKKRMRF